MVVLNVTVLLSEWVIQGFLWLPPTLFGKWNSNLGFSVHDRAYEKGVNQHVDGKFTASYGRVIVCAFASWLLQKLYNVH
jgi:hypothetical protein